MIISNNYVPTIITDRKRRAKVAVGRLDLGVHF